MKAESEVKGDRFRKQGRQRTGSSITVKDGGVMQLGLVANRAHVHMMSRRAPAKML